MKEAPTFYEFFAGGGMARAGLGARWKCLFANDIDPKKGATYVENWGAACLKVEDVGLLSTVNLPERAQLAWASFPCQDLSLAGAGGGLNGERSGTFWAFWRLIKALRAEGRAPSLVVLENVCGALTSHGGEDFAAIGAALTAEGYRFGALVMDAVHFVPQSRPRLFVVGVDHNWPIAGHLTAIRSEPLWHPTSLLSAYDKLSQQSKAAWVWWNLPSPQMWRRNFSDLIEDEPLGVKWHTSAETERLLGMMSPLNRQKVREAMCAKRRIVGGIYKRTRKDMQGKRVQRAEIRFDDVAGCLRTPMGGSSRQLIMIVEGDKVQSRLLSPREAARLMGLPDTYKLPDNYNLAYHVVGDGVVIPVVRFLAAHILEPLLDVEEEIEREAA